MKRLVIGLVALGVILVGVLVALVLRFDAELLGASLIEQINQKSTFQVEAERFSLHPLRGLELHNAAASGRVESGDLRIEVALVEMQHQLLPLLWGRLVVSEVLLHRPNIELTSRPAAEKRGRQADQIDKEERARRKQERRERRERRRAKKEDVLAESPTDRQSRQLHLSIESLKIDEGSLAVRTPGSDPAELRIEELNLALSGVTVDPAAGFSTESVSGAGRFSTGVIDYGDFQAIQSGGDLRLEAGIATLREFNVRSENADLIIQALTVFLLQEPPGFTLTAAGGLDLNGILGVEGGEGFGPVAIDLAAEGVGPESEELTGKGVLSLQPGAIPGIGSIVQIEELLGQPLLTGKSYQATDVQYRLVANSIVLEPFEIVGEGGNVGGSGTIEVNGSVDLEVFVRFPRQSLDAGDLEDEKLQALSEEQGMVTVPFRISGTMEDPSVRLSWEGIRNLGADEAESWAEQVLDEAKKKAAEWLKSQSEESDDG